MSKKSPQLRFEGFTDDWEQRKLSGIIEKLSGGASIKPTDYLEDGIRTIPKGAVNATGIADLSGSKYISEDFFEKNITSHAHTSNLVTSLRDLVPSAPNMGRIVRIEGDDEQFLMPQGVYKLELFEGMEEDFLISFSNSDKYRKIISAEKNGSTQVHIRNGEFLNIDINLPSEHEQNKIGSFFKQLDNTIALHQRKLDLLKEQKKGYLQKMFPKNGAKVPELRFAGFADDWEERKLGELLKSAYQGINTAGDKVIYSEKGVEILQSKHITSGYITFDDTRFLDKKRYSGYFPKYVPKKHDILFANIGTIGPSTVVETNKEFLIAWNILKMTPNENVNSKFIELFLQILNEKHYYEKITTGNATKFVNKDAILNIELCISSFKEQQKIGSFFQQLDNTIALHQRKLDLLKEQKKGFLQTIFAK